MTKVTLHYDLARPLTEEDFERIGDVHSTYGIVRVMPDAAQKHLTVDYDASRLMKRDVEAVLQRFGLPILTSVNA